MDYGKGQRMRGKKRETIFNLLQSLGHGLLLVLLKPLYQYEEMKVTNSEQIPPNISNYSLQNPPNFLMQV